MSNKSQFKILYSKNGITRFEETTGEMDFHPGMYKNLLSWENIANKKREYEIVNEIIKSYKPISERQRYVTINEFNEVKQLVYEIKNNIENLSMKQQKMPKINALLDTAKEDLSQIAKEAFFKLKNSQLYIYAIIDFSSETIEKISEIEIKISKKYPEIAFEIEPLMCKNDVPQYSQLLLVKE